MGVLPTVREATLFEGADHLRECMALLALLQTYFEAIEHMRGSNPPPLLRYEGIPDTQFIWPSNIRSHVIFVSQCLRRSVILVSRFYVLRALAV